MNAIKCKTRFLIVFIWCIGSVFGEQRASTEPKQHTVDDFVRQLAVIFQQSFHSAVDFSSVSRGKNGSNANYFGNLQRRPQSYNPFESGSDGNYGFGLRPVPPYLPSNYPSLPPRPYMYPASFGVNNYPLYPLGYRPPVYGNSYPQTSLLAALDSISKYDDLRCVPRLLCEVTTGSRAELHRPVHNEENNSPVPFLSRDAFITLLTILNFVDDSPLLSFARAAFLGYSSRGDTRACLNAYPTCPRDPDQLIDYLNNHNGGFFRFFNQQLLQQPQYAPQYQQLVQKYHQQRDERPSYSNEPTRSSTSRTHVEAITPRYVTTASEKNSNSRILNDPIDIEYVGDKDFNTPTRQEQNQSELKLKLQNKIVFQNVDQIVEPQIHENVRETFKTVRIRQGRKFAFPGQYDKGFSYGMIFPDKTGTGNLILSSDVDGHYKILFRDDETTNRTRKLRKLRFQEDGHYSKRALKFPREENA